MSLCLCLCLLISSSTTSAESGDHGVTCECNYRSSAEMVAVIFPAGAGHLYSSDSSWLTQYRGFHSRTYWPRVILSNGGPFYLTIVTDLQINAFATMVATSHNDRYGGSSD